MNDLHLFCRCDSLYALEEHANTRLCKAVLTEHLYHIMKHFCRDGRGLFQDGNVPMHQGLMRDLFMHKSD